MSRARRWGQSRLRPCASWWTAAPWIKANPARQDCLGEETLRNSDLPRVWFSGQYAMRYRALRLIPLSQRVESAVMRVRCKSDRANCALQHKDRGGNLRWINEERPLKLPNAGRDWRPCKCLPS